MEWLNHSIKDVINFLANPVIYFTLAVLAWTLLMKFHRVWIQAKYIKVAFWASIIILGWAMTDSNFFKEATKPDNIPIWIMSYGVAFFFWLAIKKGAENDRRTEAGEPIFEKTESDKKVYTWPDLVYSELICMVAFTAFMLIWGIVFDAPLEDPANSGITPAIAKAPWYFLGLQELLVYFDPWIAGVALPGLIVGGLVAIPYIDMNPKGNGYYTVKERFPEIFLYGFGFIVLWIALIFLGTFMRGPGWNFFGPFEYWDAHKVVPMNNVFLSEIFWIKILNRGMPDNILIREGIGLTLVVAYLFVLPVLLKKLSFFKNYYDKLGVVRYYITITLFLVMMSVPLKMYLRWAFNLKYIVSIPEYLFNI